MAASGLPERCPNHAQVLCALALDMLDASKKVKIKKQSLQVCLIIIPNYWDYLSRGYNFQFIF